MPRFVIQSICEQCRAIDGKWFLQLEGSWESVSLGKVMKSLGVDDKLVAEPRPFKPGDKIQVTIETAPPKDPRGL